MAPENLKGKKRKVAADSAPQPKKQKKSDKVASSTIPSTQLIDNAVKAVDDALAKTKAPGKHADNTSANDILPQQELQVEKKGKKKGKTAAASIVETKQFPSGKAEITKVEIVKTEAEAAPETIEPPKQLSKEEKRAKKWENLSEKKKKSKEERLEKWKALSKEQKMEKRKPKNGDDDNDEEDVEDEDDQTAALLAGFESEGDESDDEQENSKINVAALKKQVPEGLLEKLEGVSSKGKETGVVFVGRIPHGFYEPQMQKYFSQFGDVTRVRVSRNKKTGASKHYAFVEFANAEVADIVAKTMDKYLMFGRILQCKVIPQAQVHAKLFEGANRRFKIVPRNKLAGAQMKHGAERPVWEKRVANEAKRREVTSKKLKESLGYEFEPPQLRSVEDVPKKALALGDAPDKQSLPESLAVEVGSEVQIDQTQPGHMELTQTSKTKKSKKGKKTEAEPTETQPEPVEVAVAVDDAKIVVEKPKKGKKIGAQQTEAQPEPLAVTVAVDDAKIVIEKKPKKGKKAAPVSEAEPVTSQVDEAEPIVEKKVKKSKKKSESAPEPELAAVPVDNADPVVEKKAKKSKKSKLETSVPEATVQAELEEEYADKPKKRKSLDGAPDGKVKKSKKAKA